MHILYLHQYFVPPEGSGGTRSYEFARRWVAAGHRVTMITSSAFFPPTEEWKAPVTTRTLDGITVRIIHAPYSNNLGYRRRISVFLAFAVRSSLEAIRHKNVDIVFATSTPLTIAVPALVAKWRWRRPMVFEVRDLWPEVPIAMGAIRNPLLIAISRWLERLAYRNASHIIALSPGMRDGVVRCNVPTERVTVISNAADVDLFRVAPAHGQDFIAKHDTLAGRPLVVYAGTFGAANGVGYLVRIAAEMKSIFAEAAFVVAGSGRDAAEIEADAKRRGVFGHNFIILAPLSKRNMPSFFSAATVTVSLFIENIALWNNSANKVFDALAAGRPVIINYGGWQAEILERSGAGLVIPPNDPKRAAELIAGFLRDESRLRAARIAATRLADIEFNRDILSRSLLGILETVAARMRT